MARALPMDDGAYGAGSIFGRPLAGERAYQRGLRGGLSVPRGQVEPLGEDISGAGEVLRGEGDRYLPPGLAPVSAPTLERIHGALWRDSDGDLWVTDTEGKLLCLTVAPAAHKYGATAVEPLEPSWVDSQWGPLEPVNPVQVDVAASIARDAHEMYAWKDREIEQLRATLAEVAAERDQHLAAVVQYVDRLDRYQTRTGGADVVAAAAELAAGGAVDQLAAERDELRRQVAHWQGEHRKAVTLIAQEMGHHSMMTTELDQMAKTIAVAIAERDHWRGELIELRAKVEFGDPNHYEPAPWDVWDKLDGGLRYQFAHSVQVFGPPPPSFVVQVLGNPFSTQDVANLMDAIASAGQEAQAALALAAGEHVVGPDAE